MIAFVIEHLFHKETGTLTYLVYNSESRDAVVIDPVLDYDPQSGMVSHSFLNQTIDRCRQLDLKVVAILDTHFHADHPSGSFYLKKHFNVDAIIGEGFLQSQRYFSDRYNLPVPINPPYEKLLRHGETISLGTISLQSLSLKGHTPSCMGYLIGDAIFVGDSVFTPERGCGRVDFPGGSAKELFHSIHDHLYTLPSDVRIFVGHDYPLEGNSEVFETTVEDTRAKNIMLNDAISEDEFITKREQKDQTLNLPRLFDYSTKANIYGGDLPKT